MQYFLFPPLSLTRNLTEYEFEDSLRSLVAFSRSDRDLSTKVNNRFTLYGQLLLAAVLRVALGGQPKNE